MHTKSEYIEARSEYIDLIKAELLGPGSEVSIPDAEHELISTSPEQRYSIGILYTKNNRMSSSHQESDNDEKNDEEEYINPFFNSNDEDEWFGESKDESYGEADIGSEVAGGLDEEINLASQNMPSSMGLVFLSSKHLDSITCEISFAVYRKAKLSDCKVPVGDKAIIPDELSNYLHVDEKVECVKLKQSISQKDCSLIYKKLKDSDIDQFYLRTLYKLCDQLNGGYIREPHHLKYTIEFDGNDTCYSKPDNEVDNVPDFKITALQRKINEENHSITIMLVNDSMEKSNGMTCIFQPEIMIASDENGFLFKSFSTLQDIKYLSEEEQSLELLYRDKKTYGTGLGVALDWKIDSYGRGIIKTTYFPQHEMPNMSFSPSSEYYIDKKCLSMKYLSDLDKTQKEEKIKSLWSIPNAYGVWISKLESSIPAIDQYYKDIVIQNISRCKEVKSRIEQGLNLLKNNDDIWSSFQLSNRAMFIQRVHIELQKLNGNGIKQNSPELKERLLAIDYQKNEGITQDRYFWRLFQIAFLLLSLDGITDDKSPDRNKIDLIWFPTGGGKTEAYLGLTAFTIFYRRLVHPKESDGTAIIMRYTLRLLASQQFTRASTLICACEMIRCDATNRKPKYGAYQLGKKEITIGLWIGGKHTPNSNDDARKTLNRLSKVNNVYTLHEVSKTNNFQVLRCPFCGTPLIAEDREKKVYGKFCYELENNKRFHMYCPQEGCFFHTRNELPVQVVDEELYNTPPTLLFGTVDKFAMLPWIDKVGRFLGVDTSNRPPELIIQDELHLISGPLGTIFGLYETAIDLITRKKGCPTKIVASTATIRKAHEQCYALFNREVNQFPPSAIDSGDSFFAKEECIDYSRELFGRTYIGLMPSGKTKAMMQIRVIAALLQKINTMKLSDEVKDAFWTLTVYFNSLKDLGKCSTLVEDDIKDFVKRIAFRCGTNLDARRFTTADELTSRISTTQLTETLDKLSTVKYSSEASTEKKKKYPVNVLLATNMISVGIDVDRLNVMLLVGQPKLTSEYIQASSRIGRSFPGVAFIQYDGTKSRDRSHYEQFKPYHESFYKYVEPTAATPFSKPARDRALHAIVIALVRLLDSSFTPEKKAGEFRIARCNSIEDIKQFISERAKSIIQHTNISMKDDSDEINNQINSILKYWEQEAIHNNSLVYGFSKMVSSAKGTERLMKTFENSDSYDNALNTMTSMRNVDSSVEGDVLIFEEDSKK